MFLDISYSTVRELLGNQTFCGYHPCANKQVTCGQVCSSLSVGFLVVTPSIVSFEENEIIKSWSSVSMKIVASEKGLSSTIISYAHSWLVFNRVWYIISPIQIDLLSIRIVVSPVSGLLYAVFAWTIGPAFIVSYTSVYGATSHSLTVKSTTMQLEPQTVASACESRSILLYKTDTQHWANTFLLPAWKREILRLSIEWILAMLHNIIFFSMVRLVVMNMHLTK